MNANSTLHLTLFRKWFDLIAAGQKIEEYRSKTDFWRKRLVGRKYDVIVFRNGYCRNAPQMTVEFLGLKDGIFEGQEVFAIQLGRILKFKNYEPPYR